MSALTMSPIEFDETVKRLHSKGITFKVKNIGSTKTVYYKDNVYCKSQTKILSSKDGFNSKDFRNFLSQFNKNIFKQLRDVDGLIDLKINKLYDSTVKINFANWENIELGECIYEFDIKSAYWQTAYLLNYINSKMFNNYLNKKEAKMYKRLCFSFLARRKKITHYSGADSYEIVCDNEILNRIYDNVRITLSNNINYIVNQTDSFIKFNVDAIYVDLKNATIVSRELKSLGYDFHFRVWQKISITEIANKITTKKI